MHEDIDACLSRIVNEEVHVLIHQCFDKSWREHSVRMSITIVFGYLVVWVTISSYILVNVREHFEHDFLIVRLKCRYRKSLQWVRLNQLRKTLWNDQCWCWIVENVHWRIDVVVREPKWIRTKKKKKKRNSITSVFVLRLRSRMIFINMNVVDCRSIVV